MGVPEVYHQVYGTCLSVAVIFLLMLTPFFKGGRLSIMSIGVDTTFRAVQESVLETIMLKTHKGSVNSFH